MAIKYLQITVLVIIVAMAAHSCGQSEKGGNFTEAEKTLIHEADSVMRVLTVKDPADIFVLRSSSSDLPAEALLSSEYKRLTELMVATVTHPSQDGVGIAGPQVGLNRRVVAVQRFDKDPVLRGDRLDYPFEVYPNVRIVWASDSLAYGPEGCLSVPDMRGEVLRSQEIIIEYADMKALSSCCHDGSEGEAAGCRQLSDCIIPTVRDTIKGFTAVIFQHEIDHLDGILYTDRL